MEVVTSEKSQTCNFLPVVMAAVLVVYRVAGGRVTRVLVHPVERRLAAERPENNVRTCRHHTYERDVKSDQFVYKFY